MVDVRLGHTARLSPALLAAARALLADAFAGHADGEFDEDDWEHSVGGMHALVTRGEGDAIEVLAHGSLVQRRLVHWPPGPSPADRPGEGRVLRCGYVEAVAVRADQRGRGLGAAVMDALEALLPAYELGALGSSEEAVGFYAARGWQEWRGRTWVLAPGGLERTPEDDDGVRVLPTPGGPALDLDGELACDWREGDVW